MYFYLLKPIQEIIDKKGDHGKIPTANIDVRMCSCSKLEYLATMIRPGYVF